MSKKLIMACMALVAFAAFAMPSVAAASPEIGETLEPGVWSKLATGTKIQGTLVGHSTLWNTGHTSRLVTCTAGKMTGTLTKNSGTEIEGTIETASFTGTKTEERCENVASGGATKVDTNIGNGVPWCLRAVGTEDKFTVRGNSCANAARSITFVLTDSVIGTCKYVREAAVEGTYTTDATGDAIGTVVPTVGSQFTKEEGGILCPASGELEMSFTLETDPASGTAAPLYIR